MNPLNDGVLETELYERLVTCADFLRRDLLMRASAANLAGPDFLALRELAMARAPLTPSDLALLMRCSRSQITKVTDRLLAAQYIKKDRIPWTPRTKMIELTSSGLEALAHAIVRVESAKPFAPLTSRQQKQLHHLLGRLQQAFETIPPADEVHA